LRLFAAIFVLLFAAFYTTLFESPASAAGTYSLTEYNTLVDNANSAVTATQTALDAAQAAYDNSSIPVVTPTGSGIKVDVYNSSATRTPNANTFCRSTVFTQIAVNWGAGSVAGCNNDHVVIHYYGTITVPDTGAYKFMNIADDGWYMTLNGQLINNDWRDKGCGGSWSQPIQLTAGTAYNMDAWYYENGGGACSTLYVVPPSGNSQVMPASWFGQGSTTTYTKDPALLPAIDQAAAALQSVKDALAAIPSKVINPPANLLGTVDGATVTLSWDAPSEGLLPERYAVMWTDGVGGWGVASTTTSLTIDASVVASTAGWNKSYTFTIRSDQDTAQMYSSYSNPVTIFLPEPAPVVVPSPAPLPSETPTSTVQETSSVSAPQDTFSVTTPETGTTTTAQDQTPTNSSDPSPTPAPSPDPAVEPQQPSPSQEDTQTAQSPSEPVQPSTSPLPSDSQPVSAQQPDPLPAPAPAPVAAPDPAPQTQPDVPAPADAPDPAAADPSAAADAPATADPAGTDAPAPAPEPAPAPAPEGTPNPAPDPAPAPQPAADNPPVAADPQPAPAPSTDPTTDSSATPGLIPNNPDSLPDSIPKLPDESNLVPHVQEDKAGVENGGIEFFGTKTQPQVVGEDGKLTPPPPPPGSGLPIPPDAITLSDTFIGQPGGTTFNAPDVAVPVIETPVTGALAAVPGVQALNHAFVAMANIGNDMSPITRKKAKKILVLTTVIAAVRRRFGN